MEIHWSKYEISARLSADSVVQFHYKVQPWITTTTTYYYYYCYSALMLLVGRQEGHPACKKLSGGVLAWLSLKRGADLHIVQLMLLLLTVSCFSEIQLILPFWFWLTRVVPEKRAVKRVCVCVLHYSYRPRCNGVLSMESFWLVSAPFSSNSLTAQTTNSQHAYFWQ